MSIHLENISKKYDGNVLIESFSYSFPDKGLYLITGNSGFGKSTLLDIIAGLTEPDSGTVYNDDGSVSFAFQEDRLFPWYNVLKNASIAGDREQAAQMLEMLGLSDSLKKHPNELSGGMRRRVSLVRAFVRTGVPLLIDEPFRGLDDELKKTVAQMISEQASQRLVICATHEKEQFMPDDIIQL